MAQLNIILALVFLASYLALATNEPDLKRQECLIIAELNSGKTVFRKESQLCRERIYAASTFKIPLALMAFDTGVLTDPESLLKWNGTQQSFKAWEKDHNAKSWLKDSVVWFSKLLTPKLGLPRIMDYLKDFRYGNQDFTGGIDRAWLDSTLKISPLEQIEFLRRLKLRELKLQSKTIETVLSILPVEVDRPGFSVVGKTGSDSTWDDINFKNKSQFRVGWYIGFMEVNSRQYVFASALKDISANRTFVFSGREAKELAMSALNSAWLASKINPGFSQKNRLEDFRQLLQIMSDTYPNLDSIVENEKLDLPKLSRKAKREIKKAATDTEVIQLFQDFIKQFHDGHFHLEAPIARTQMELQQVEKSKLDRSTPGPEACRTIVDAQSKKIEFSFPISEKLGFSKVQNQASAFSYTSLNILTQKVGFLKIPSFVAGNYPVICDEEWNFYRKSMPAEICDEGCQDKFKNEILPNRLLREIEQALENLKKVKISALVVDLSDNGGGNDWVNSVTRMLTNKPILCGQFGFIRHPHWVKQFTELKNELKVKLAAAKSDEERQQLQLRMAEAELDLGESKKICHRPEVWEKKVYHPTCSIVVKKQLNACNPPEELIYKSGVYAGPLFLLVNKYTASASEDLVGRHKDSATATIIGQRTLGSGCGFTNGGVNLRLKKSGLIVKVSDCARFLRNGSNEVLGIDPDIELPMDSVETDEFTKKLRAKLAGALHIKVPPE